MRHTRAGVLARARRECAALDRLVRRLRPADWARPVPRPPGRDPWTVKDALAHIVFWKEHTARVIRGERRPPDLRGLDVKRLNRLVYERWRRRPPAEVVRWHRAVQADVVRALRSRAPEWFTARERSPEWPLDLDAHSADHRRRDIEAALEAAGTGISRRPPARPSRPRAANPRVPGPPTRASTAVTGGASQVRRRQAGTARPGASGGRVGAAARPAPDRSARAPARMPASRRGARP